MPNPTTKSRGETMSDEERAEVIELLRCAADNASRLVLLPLLTAIDDCGTAQPVNGLAFNVYCVTFAEQTPVASEHQRECAALLEAAQRVEEGSWPSPLVEAGRGE